MAEPPFDPAVNAMEPEVLPLVATREVGADGLVEGVNELDAREAEDGPFVLTAFKKTV
jgi:hypothetical protein